MKVSDVFSGTNADVNGGRLRGDRPHPQNNSVARPTECGQTGGTPTATMDKIKIDGDDAKVNFEIG